MTISELIERLRDVKSQHGDIPVTVDDENGEHDEITDVRLGGSDYFLPVGKYEKEKKHVNIS